MNDAEFDRHAADYKAQHAVNIALSGEEPAYFAEYKMRDFKSLLQQAGQPLKGRFLDFGSGVGASVPAFRALLPSAQLVCADVSANSLALSRQLHGDGVDHVCIPEGRLPFADATFDGAFACCVFHHIPRWHQRRVLQDLHRVLKPGALLMVYEHNPLNPLTVRAVRSCPFDEQAVLLTARQLRRVALDAGWSQPRHDYRVFFPAALARLRPLERSLRWLPLGAQYVMALRA